MKNSIDELYDYIREKDYIDKFMLKDIVVIDGAISQNEDLKYKEKTLKELEQKYEEKLNARLYFKIKNLVDTKSDKVDREEKINNELGNLKLWIIRIAVMDTIDTRQIQKLFDSIDNEKNVKTLYKKLNEIDTELLKSVS